MLMPLLVGLHAHAAPYAAGEAHADVSLLLAQAGSFAAVDLLAVGVHTVAMFVVMAVIALVVYERVGLKILRSAWINLDRIWAITLILTGAVTLVL
jgi:hypothetical protein